MRINREGLGLIIGGIFASGTLILGSIVTGHLHLKIMAGLVMVLTLFFVLFFRDPNRKVSNNSNEILSPADGTVVDIHDEYEDQFLKEKCTRISVFLSIFNVHVNRIPISGRIAYFQYQKGSFVNALKSQASEVNEQTIIGIENSKIKILFKQIAGLIARRIVCNVREGHNVERGERFGMIKFGSRVDIFLPKQVEIKVRLKQKVKGGQSIIGVL